MAAASSGRPARPASRDAPEPRWCSPRRRTGPATRRRGGPKTAPHRPRGPATRTAPPDATPHRGRGSTRRPPAPRRRRGRERRGRDGLEDVSGRHLLEVPVPGAPHRGGRAQPRHHRGEGVAVGGERALAVRVLGEFHRTGAAHEHPVPRSVGPDGRDRDRLGRAVAARRRTGPRVDDDQALALHAFGRHRRPGPEPHQVLPGLGRDPARGRGGVPGGGAPALPPFGVDAGVGRVDRHLVDSGVRVPSLMARPPRDFLRAPRTPGPPGPTATDSAASAAEFSGCRSSATAHISSPRAAAKPSTNHAPRSGTSVRVLSVVDLQPVGAHQHAASNRPLGAVYPERTARVGGDNVADDPQDRSRAGGRCHRQGRGPRVARLGRLAGHPGVGGLHGHHRDRPGRPPATCG